MKLLPVWQDQCNFRDKPISVIFRSILKSADVRGIDQCCIYTHASPIIAGLRESDHDSYARRVRRVFARAEQPTGAYK